MDHHAAQEERVAVRVGHHRLDPGPDRDVHAELNRHAGKRRMVTVALGQLVDHMTNGLLDLWVQGVVVGAARVTRAVHLPPGSTLGVGHFNGAAGVSVLPP